MAALLTGALGSGNAQARSPAEDYRYSVSVFPAFFLGEIRVVLECLAAERHGILAEGEWSPFGTARGSYAVGAGYRYHFSEDMESAFLGVFGKTGFVRDQVESGGATYGFSTPLTSAGLNFGKRWQWNNGLSAIGRIGYGFPLTDIRWSPQRPASDATVAWAHAMLGIDGEATVGYSW